MTFRNMLRVLPILLSLAIAACGGGGSADGASTTLQATQGLEKRTLAFPDDLTDAEALRYVASYPDLIAAFGTDTAAAKTHFASQGRNEGRTLSFDAGRYLATYPDLFAAYGNDLAAATRHYIVAGHREGRSATFDGLIYIASYADLIVAFGADQDAGVRHDLAFGINEGRAPTFAPLSYIAAYPDLIAAFGVDTVGATRHYITQGSRENRVARFDGTQYLVNYPDVAAAYGLDANAAALHFIVYGRSEGRTDRPTAPTTALSKSAGDAQAAAVGKVVATPPQITVRDSRGVPLAGVEVKFQVTAGGGQIGALSTRTGADGTAAPGAWTLGPARGPNSLLAYVQGAVPVMFTAQALASSADIKVTLRHPVENESLNDTLTVSADIGSTYQLRSIRATVGNVTAELTYGTWFSENDLDRNCARLPCPGYGARFSLAAFPRGPLLVVLSAADALGNVTDVSTRVLVDKSPSIVIDEPLDRSVARSGVNLRARCVDDDPAGCASLTATLNDIPIAGVTPAGISKPLDLSASEGKMAVLTLKATDSAGRRAEVSRWIYVESSARLAAVDEVDGPIWDSLGTRTLYLDLLGPVPALKIKDAATGAIETVETGADLIATFGSDYGFLTRQGAIYVHGIKTGNVGDASSLFEWRNGISTALGKTSIPLSVAGDWAVHGQGTNVWLRNLTTGASRLVTADGSYPVVAPNGDITFYRAQYDASYKFVGGKLYRVRDGVESALMNDLSLDLIWDTAATDGVNLVYARGSTSTGYRIALNDGSRESLLSAAAPNAPRPPPPLRLTGQRSPGEAFTTADYAVNGGYVAYINRDAFRSENVWRHGPAGEQQITFLAASFSVEDIGPDGTIFYKKDGVRYRSRIGFDPEAIGSSLGRVLYRDGKPVVIIGRSVFEVR